MEWFKCSERMPGQEDDFAYNKELDPWCHAGFLVCYTQLDDEPSLARCYLEKGKFILNEYCRSWDECPDRYQKKYWDDETNVTHWAYIYWPIDID